MLQPATDTASLKEHTHFVCSRCGAFTVRTRRRPSPNLILVVLVLSTILVGGVMASLTIAYLAFFLATLVVEGLLIALLVALSELWRPWAGPRCCGTCGSKALLPIWGAAGLRLPCPACGERSFRWEEAGAQER